MASAGKIPKTGPVTPDSQDAAPASRLVPLIFEESSPGRSAADLPPANAAAVKILGEALCRDDLPGFPELSEPQVVRHFLRLSRLNFAQALEFYPLGSCTMKYNPVVNDELAALPGFAHLHPLTPDHLAQGALELIAAAEQALAEITGMDAVSVHPAAGAQGELAGLLIARAYHRKRGERRRKVIIPDTAHGTNPASCSLAGFEAVVVRSDARGVIQAEELRRMLDGEVAAMMVTNPNTLGVFEPEIEAIAAALHECGALLYLDGANMNALFGIARPGDMGADIVHLNLHKSFSTPHGGGGPGAGPIGVKRFLEPFLPGPRVAGDESVGWRLDYDRPDSIGRLRAFHGNFGIVVRALAYILALGGDGLAMASRLAILNANYLRKLLEEDFPSASVEPSMHECVLTHELESRAGVSTLDIAKRLLDYRIHPPTIYFPSVVHGALMIEPTETESRQTLDEFAAAMKRIHAEALSDPETVKRAPHSLPVGRVDEAAAARHPVLTWKPS